jgi:hypothetical protein
VGGVIFSVGGVVATWVEVQLAARKTTIVVKSKNALDWVTITSPIGITSVLGRIACCKV